MIMLAEAENKINGLAHWKIKAKRLLVTPVKKLFR